MREREVKPEIAAVRRAAAAKRWEGHSVAPTRTVRLRLDLIAELEALPGESMSDKIEWLVRRARGA